LIENENAPYYLETQCGLMVISYVTLYFLFPIFYFFNIYPLISMIVLSIPSIKKICNYLTVFDLELHIKRDKRFIRTTIIFLLILAGFAIIILLMIINDINLVPN